MAVSKVDSALDRVVSNNISQETLLRCGWHKGVSDMPAWEMHMDRRTEGARVRWEDGCRAEGCLGPEWEVESVWEGGKGMSLHTNLPEA